MSLQKTAISLTLIMLAACSKSASTTKGFEAASDTTPKIVRDLDQMDLHWALVDRANVEQYVTPAKSTPNGLPESIAGIWWTKGWLGMKGLPTGPLLITLANATWDAKTRTAELVILGPNNYAFENTVLNTATFNQTVSDGQQVSDPTQATYTIQFSDDQFDYATIQLKITDGEGGRAVDTGHVYTMAKQSDGSWLRKSSTDGLPLWDYDMIQITDGNGNHIKKNYENRFLIGAFGKIAVVLDHNLPNWGIMKPTGGGVADDRAQRAKQQADANTPASSDSSAASSNDDQNSRSNDGSTDRKTDGKGR